MPSQCELDQCVTEFQEDWGLVDEVLYELCRRHPHHDDRREVTAKLALVGRVYAAGLERRVTPPPGEQAITVVAKYVQRHGREVDRIIHALDHVTEPLEPASMGLIVEQHGRLTELLRERATDGKAPRSFASKYLHFHRPFVPIYDEYARQKLSGLVPWEAGYRPFAPPVDSDREYLDFCVRFYRLYAACQADGLLVTVKSLDAYLWGVPTPAKRGDAGA